MKETNPWFHVGCNFYGIFIGKKFLFPKYIVDKVQWKEKKQKLKNDENDQILVSKDLK